MHLNETVPFISQVSFVVSIVFFFFAVTQLIHEKKPLSNYFLSIIYCSVGIQFLSFPLYFRNSPIFETWFYYIDTAFLFPVGAFLYLFFLYITSDSSISSGKILCHGSPFFLSLLLIAAVNLLNPSFEDKKELLLMDIITSLSYLSLFLYMILIYRMLLVHNRKHRSGELKILIFIIICSLASSFFLLFSNTLWPKLQVVGHIAYSWVGLCFIFFLIRYPDFFKKAQKESQEIRYRKSQLARLDKDELVARLETLMARDRIYRDSQLTLKELSVKLAITSPQLSELLNSHYGSSFNSFINSYRIEEIKVRLEEEEDVNILQTAFDCGFNSKTTFNTAFRKSTGFTPTQFREKTRSDL